ncbi:GtrA family protein [Vibrio chagasii]|uniref:GtrA family protein n=1 Tax=Vibrio chagasii TaxID=170679 RepID=UPI003DA9F0BD
MYTLLNSSLFRFLCVGLCNFGITMFLYYLFSMFLDYVLASCIAFVLSVVNSYFFNKNFVFRSNEDSFILFFLFNMPALVLNNATIYYLIDSGVNYMIAQTISVILIAIVNFNLFSFVFCDKDNGK